MLGIGVGINRKPLGAASYAEQLAKAYEARVIADGGVVESLGCFTAFATSLGAYQPPIALAATGIGEISFTANWKPFKDAKYYLLDVSTSPTFATFVYENEIVPAPTTSYVVIGLNSNTTYYYRVRASTTFDPDYQAVLDYATTQGYTLPSAGQQVLQNQLVVDLKDAGIWSKLDTFAVFATDGSSDFALIDWIRLTDYTAINSPTFTTNQGFNGNGTSAYIDTNFNPVTQGTNYTQNNASRYAYMLQVQSSMNIDVSGQITSNLKNRMLIGNSSYQSINTVSANSTSFSYTTNAGMKSINRLDSSNVNLYNDKVFSSVTSTADVLESLNQWLLRAATNFSSTHLISMYAMGGDLVAENDDFVDAFDTYINAL